MTSIICLFKLAHLNDLICDEWVNHVVKEFNVQEVLKSTQNGVEFHQGSNGTIRSSLATSYDLSRRRANSQTFYQSEAEKLSQTDRQNDTESTYCQAPNFCVTHSFSDINYYWT